MPNLIENILMPEEKNTKLEFDIGSENSTPRIIRDNGFNECRQQVLNNKQKFIDALVEEVEKMYRLKEDAESNVDELYGGVYNKAIEDIINVIKNI